MGLWIASVPDGHQRITLSQESLGKQRVRCVLNAPPWFNAALQEIGCGRDQPNLLADAPGSKAASRSTYGHTALKLQGLVIVRPGSIVNNQSTLSAESALLLDYYHEPCDAAALMVVTSAALQLGVKIDLVEHGSRQMISNPKHGRFCCHVHFTEPAVASSYRINVLNRQPVDSCRVKDICESPPRPAIVLPEPLALLLVRGRLKNLIWLARSVSQSFVLHLRVSRPPILHATSVLN